MSLVLCFSALFANAQVIGDPGLVVDNSPALFMIRVGAPVFVVLFLLLALSFYGKSPKILRNWITRPIIVIILLVLWFYVSAAIRGLHMIDIPIPYGL